MLNRFRAPLFCLFLLTPAIAVHAQSDDNQHQTIRSAVEAENWPAVISETTKLRTTNPNLFQTRNYDYLLARAAEKTGDKPLASGQYQGVIARQSALTDYALWHLSRMARATGDLVQEREHLRRLTTRGSNSLLHDA